LRILATVERYAPAIGGAERVVQRISEGLAKRGHDVHVLTGGAAEDAELGGVKVHRVAVSGNEARGIRGDAGAVLRTIERVAPDIVFNYAAQTWATDCCFELLSRPDRPRMVMAPCGFSGLRSRRYRDYFASLGERLRRYDALVLHSAVYQDWDFARDAGAGPMFVVPNGADPPADRDALGLRSPGEPLVVTVGSHVYSKGHGEFAGTIRQLVDRRPVRGAIVAPPRHGLDALRGCQAACSFRARHRSLQLVNGSSPATVAAVLAAADLFLFTSRIECAPLVVLEAMAAATPWISYDVGNVSELPGGVVVGARDDLLPTAMRLLDDPDSDLGAEGHAAWETTHRWELIIPRYESVFEEVLSGTGA
jgi:glycosyltransferase involved in cell wall biosynthesis